MSFMTIDTYGRIWYYYNRKQRGLLIEKSLFAFIYFKVR